MLEPKTQLQCEGHCPRCKSGDILWGTVETVYNLNIRQHGQCVPCGTKFVEVQQYVFTEVI
ncbi:hypothetical protein LCGC14_1966930 [marine sediment metagenome]|uniref:Uncharacterized protein n=1 Tax=marine sediment metagenome TaxID=412755 RepID=A0A0F9G159_9ZZZZ